MLKKTLKIILIILVIIIVLVGLALTWLFSSSGNNFVKEKITQIVNEKTQMGIDFAVFELGFSGLKIALTDKQNSTVAIGANYSLFTLNGDATVNALIHNIAPYEPLIGMPLKGSIQLEAQAQKQGSDINAKGQIQAFSSQINFQTLLQDYSPKKLLIDVPNGINIQSLLNFLGQQPYASGLLLVNADLDISSSTPQGGFKIASNNLLPNAKIFKEFGIEIPSNEALVLAIIGEATQNAIVSNLDIASSYLKTHSKDFTINAKDFSTNGIINLSLNHLTAYGIKLTSPLVLEANLLSKNIASQTAAINLQWITAPLVANISMPNYQPKEVTLQWDKASLAEILHFFKLPYKANGNINLNAKVDKINLNTMDYNLKADITSLIQSLEVQGFKIAENNALAINASGNPKDIVANLKSDLFNSKTTGSVELVEYSPKKAEILAENLDLQKIGALIELPLSGNLKLKAEASDISADKLKASFAALSPSISISKSTLKKLSDLDFPQDITVSLQSEGALENGEGHAYVTIEHKDGSINLTDWTFNLAKLSYLGDFDINFKDIKNINPYKLKGAIKITGNGGLQGDKPTLKANTQSFGGNLDINLHNEKLAIEGKKIDLAKLAYITDSEKIIKGGEVNLNTNLTFKLKDTIKHLSGPLNAKATNMEIYSVDIDALAHNLKNTQEIGLVDIGAFVVAGPLGLGVSKGYDFSALGINSARSTQSVIKNLVLDVDIKNGVIQTKDVALATGKTRIAAKGGINLDKKTYEKFNIAILNKKGCATLQQQIGGSLDKPKIEATRAGIQTVVNLATSLLGKIKKGSEKVLTGDEQCEIFYNGSVTAPN